MIIEALKHLLGDESLKPWSNESNGKEIDAENFSLISGRIPKIVACVDGGAQSCPMAALGLFQRKIAVVEHDGRKRLGKKFASISYSSFRKKSTRLLIWIMESL